MQEHIISYAFYQYRCFWLCSCGVGKKKSKDTYAGARKASLEHLKEAEADLTIAPVFKKYHELMEEFKVRK